MSLPPVNGLRKGRRGRRKPSHRGEPLGLVRSVSISDSCSLWTSGAIDALGCLEALDLLLKFPFFASSSFCEFLLLAGKDFTEEGDVFSSALKDEQEVGSG